MLFVRTTHTITDTLTCTHITQFVTHGYTHLCYRFSSGVILKQLNSLTFIVKAMYMEVVPVFVTGVYRHRFTVPGTYYYWSGYADEYNIISYRGVIHVTSQESYVGEVVVKVSGVEATYDLNAGMYYN
jgi:hypothetical protein